MLSFAGYFCTIFLVAIAISLIGTSIKIFKFFYDETATGKEIAQWYAVTLAIGLATIVFCNNV